MPARVVDASTVIAVAFREPAGSDIAIALVGHTLHAPTLLVYEIANAAVTKLRRHAERRAAAEQALQGALSLDVVFHPVEAAEVLFGLALSTGLSAYDAAYLWLAMHLDAPVVTLDARLANAARDVGLLAE
jgi:predicted nucleic acid-binding protein